jgi:hypothetical protein
MEEMTEIPQSLLWALCDQVIFANAFQAAIEFELIVLEWAFSKGYSREIRTNRNGRVIEPSFSGAICHLKKEPHIPESLITQIRAAWKTRNDLMHNFARKSLLLGPEQSKDCILYEAHATLKAAWSAVHDECYRDSL